MTAKSGRPLYGSPSVRLQTTSVRLQRAGEYRNEAVLLLTEEGVIGVHYIEGNENYMSSTLAKIKTHNIWGQNNAAGMSPKEERKM